MDRVATDILGPFPQYESGNRFVLLVGGLKLPSSHEFFSRFSTPFDLHSDQGCNYVSQLFKEVCELLEVNKT